MFWKYSFDLMGAQTFWETFLTNAGRGGVLNTGSDPTERVLPLTIWGALVTPDFRGIL